MSNGRAQYFTSGETFEPAQGLCQAFVLKKNQFYRSAQIDIQLFTEAIFLEPPGHEHAESHYFFRVVIDQPDGVDRLNPFLLTRCGLAHQNERYRQPA